MLRLLQRAPAVASRAMLQQQQAACFATTADSDYALVMRKAEEVAQHVSSDLPKVETGYTFGVPLDTFQRKAIILSPSRTAGQQGLGNTLFNKRAPGWKMEFETRAKWINPLMGWSSTADTLENVGRSSLYFYTKEEAVAFAEKAGWEVEVVEPKVRRTARQKRFLGYGDNFSTRRAGPPDLSTLPSNRSGPKAK